MKMRVRFLRLSLRIFSWTVISGDTSAECESYMESEPKALEAAAQRDRTGLLQLPSIDAGLDTAARLALRGDDLEIAEQAARGNIETRSLSDWVIGLRRGPCRASRTGQNASAGFSARIRNEQP